MTLLITLRSGLQDACEVVAISSTNDINIASFLLKVAMTLFGVKIITVLEEWKGINASFLKKIAKTEVVNIWRRNISSSQDRSIASTSTLHCSRNERTKVKAEGDHHIGEFICPDAMIAQK
jgi:hypothetical protein